MIKKNEVRRLKYNKAHKLAKELNKLSKANPSDDSEYIVEVVYMDFGADIKWETIVRVYSEEFPNGEELDSRYQILSPKEFETIDKIKSKCLPELAYLIYKKQEQKTHWREYYDDLEDLLNSCW